MNECIVFWVSLLSSIVEGSVSAIILSIEERLKGEIRSS